MNYLLRGGPAAYPTPPPTMPVKLTKAHQQDVVADFVDAQNLELCLFDAFIDFHRRTFSQGLTNVWKMWCDGITRGIIRTHP